MSNESELIVIGARHHISAEVVVYHKDKQIDATDVVRHLELLKVQNPSVPFHIDNEDIAEFLEDRNLIVGDKTTGFLVNTEQVDNREKILNIVANHVEKVFKKCSEEYPNGKTVIIK